MQHCVQLPETAAGLAQLSLELDGVKWVQLVGKTRDSNCVCRCHLQPLDAETGLESGELRIVPALCLQNWFEKQAKSRPALIVMSSNVAAEAMRQWGQLAGSNAHGNDTMDAGERADDGSSESDGDMDLYERYAPRR